MAQMTHRTPRNIQRGRWWGVSANYPRLGKPDFATSAEVQLNRRQREIMIEVKQEGKVTSGWCRKAFGVTYNTTYRDLSGLVDKGLWVQRGQGRATLYELNIERW
jgi:predicted HTH transcriptional regulator